MAGGNEQNWVRTYVGATSKLATLTTPTRSYQYGYDPQRGAPSSIAVNATKGTVEGSASASVQLGPLTWQGSPTSVSLFEGGSSQPSSTVTLGTTAPDDEPRNG